MSKTETRITQTMEFESHWIFSLKPKVTAIEYKDWESIRQYLNINETLYHEKKKPQNKLQISNISFSLCSIYQQLIKYYKLKISDPM